MRTQEQIESGDNILFYDETYGLVEAQVTDTSYELLQTVHERDLDVKPLEICPCEVLAVQNYDGKGEKIRGYEGNFDIFDHAGLEEALIEEGL